MPSKHNIIPRHHCNHLLKLGQPWVASETVQKRNKEEANVAFTAFENKNLK